jgi:hypothetical protein
MPVVLFIVFGIAAVVGAYVGTWLVGLIWGGLLKLGIVGRILTTLLSALPLVIVIYNINNRWFDLTTTGTDVTINTVCFGLFLLLPIWYFFWHYYAIESMGVEEFAATLRVPIILPFAGLAVGSLLVLFFNHETGMTVYKICVFGCPIIGAIYYFIKTKPYSCPKPEEAVIRWIAILVVVVITVVFGFMLPSIARSIGGASVTKYSEEAAQFKPGDLVEVIKSKIDGNESPPITSRGSSKFKNNETLKNVNLGNILTVTGKAENNDAYHLWYVPVEYEGTKGYIRMDYISLINKSKPNEPLLVAKDADIRTFTDFCSRPNRNGIIGQLNKGVSVKVTGNVSDDWSEIIYNGQTGWVLTEDLKVWGE